MSKEKQIKEALACHADERNSCDTCPYKGKGCSLRLSHDALVHINELSTNVGCKSEWISVDERLPEVAGREYLVWDDVQKTVKKRFFYRLPPSIPVETYLHLREYFGNCADYKRYTHWMPLPEPPKGSSNDS